MAERSQISLISVLLVGLSVVGCAANGEKPPVAYHEAPLAEPSRSALAVYKLENFMPHLSVEIVAIDGKRVHLKLSDAMQFEYSQGIMAGQHEIIAQLFYMRFFGANTLISLPMAVDIEPGRTYTVRGLTDGERVQIWVEDVSSGEVVGMNDATLAGEP